jgi:hypothetical protein
MKKNPVFVTSLLSIILAVITSQSYAQGGIFDIAFGVNGPRLTPIAAEQLVGAEKQTIAMRQDALIVATTSPGKYIIRRFHKDIGWTIGGPPFIGGGKVITTLGGNATAGAMTIGTGEDICGRAGKRGKCMHGSGISAHRGISCN